VAELLGEEMTEEIKLTESEQQQPKSESAEIDLAHMTPNERKRYKARLRKRSQRAHEQLGVPSGIEKRLKLEWEQNFATVKLDPDKAAALRERLFDFNVIRDQMVAVIRRIRLGIHPEVEGDGSGRFFDVIAENVILHVNQYGLVDFLPPCIIPLMTSSAIEVMKVDPKYFYRITYGLNIDGLGNLEFDQYFESFFAWYLKNRDDQQYDFDWEIADQIYHSFAIPEKFLTGIFARPQSIWTRLHRRRTGIPLPDKS
jgi:hypothetical protein